jgi:hypothetical protein
VRNPVSRYTCLSRVIIFLWMSFLWPIGLGFANDVPLPLGDFLQRPEVLGYSQLEILALNFCATVVIEYLVICAFLGWPEKAILKLGFGVLLANIITNPASQVVAIFFGSVLGSEPLAWAMICAVELVATIVEFGIMRWAFGRMYHGGLIDQPIAIKRTIVMVLTANVASFLLGFAALICLLIEIAS